MMRRVDIGEVIESRCWWKFDMEPILKNISEFLTERSRLRRRPNVIG